MKKPIYVLGINDNVNATASLMKDGRIISCISEERINRIKVFTGYPKSAIDKILADEGVTENDIDSVALAGDSVIYHFLNLKQGKANSSPSLREGPLKILAKKFIWWFNKIGLFRNFTLHDLFSIAEKTPIGVYVKWRIVRKITKNFPHAKLYFFGHHDCHCYSVLKGFVNIEDENDIAVITCDAFGDNISITARFLSNFNNKLIVLSKQAHSLGILWLKLTEYMGMLPHQHEYKIMGLAPYAKGKLTEDIKKIFYKILFFDKREERFSGAFSSDVYMFALEKNLNRKRFDYIASAIQDYTDELMADFTKFVIKKCGTKTIGLSGGTFMNVKTNMRIALINGLEKLYICPSCGDESNAFGACYLGYEKYCKSKNVIPKAEKINTLYLGPAYTKDEIKEEIDRFPLKYHIKEYENIEKQIAKLLASNRIVACFRGKMEFGARALGNRSILANPSNYANVEKINRQIKNRDFWMPFAATILDKRQKDYIINVKQINAPYMMCAFPTTKKGQNELKAAIHPYDKTIRPQILKKTDNESYYCLIEEFEKLTGIGAILNTSFNLHGEPMVCSPLDALNTFKNSDLQYLAMENLLIQKGKLKL